MRHYVSKNPGKGRPRKEDAERKSPNGRHFTTKLLNKKSIVAERGKEAERPKIVSVFWRGEDLHHFCGERLRFMGIGTYWCMKHMESVYVPGVMEPHILSKGEWEHEMHNLRMR